MNAVVKEHHVETIFDHGITDAEMRVLFFGDTESYSDYTEHLSQDSAFADISRLFRLRGNDNAANKYISQIKNDELRAQFMTIPCCVAGHSFVAS